MRLVDYQDAGGQTLSENYERRDFEYVHVDKNRH